MQVPLMLFRAINLYNLNRNCIIESNIHIYAKMELKYTLERCIK